MNRCVCLDLGAYVDGQAGSGGLRIEACERHPISPAPGETPAVAAGLRVDQCLQAIATVRELLWPGETAAAAEPAGSVEDVARALHFLRPGGPQEGQHARTAAARKLGRQGRGAKLHPGNSQGDDDQLTLEVPPWIDNLRPIDGEAALLGSAHIFGVLHHVWFVQVAEEDGCQVAVDDPYGRLAECHQLDADGSRMRTVEVPGYPGDYVLVVYPAGD